MTRLSKRFRDPAEALKFFESVPECRSLPPPLHHRDASTQADFCIDDISSQMLSLLNAIPESEQAGVVCKLMQSLAKPSVMVPHEFIAQSLVTMQRLQHAGRSNVLALLAKALGTMRPDGRDSLMPICRMPVGLIEYAVNFFGASKRVHFSTYMSMYVLTPMYVYTYYFVSRSLHVLMTTEPGAKPCIAYLVPSGPKSMGVQCGPWKQLVKRVPVNH